MAASVAPNKSQPDSEPPTAESVAVHAHRDRDGPPSRRRAGGQGHNPPSSSTTTAPSAHNWSQLFSLASMPVSDTIRGGGRVGSHSPRTPKATPNIPTTAARHRGRLDSHAHTRTTPPPPMPPESQVQTRQRVLVLLPPNAAMDRLNLTEITHSASHALGHPLRFSDIVLSVAQSPLALTKSPPLARTSNAAVQTPASFSFPIGTKMGPGPSNASHLATSSSQQPQPTTATGHGVLILTTRPKGHGPSQHHLIIRNLHPHTTSADVLALLPSPLPASLAAVFYPPHDKHKHPGRASICFFTAKDDALRALDHVTYKIESGQVDQLALRAADVVGFECAGEPPGVNARYSEHLPVPEIQRPRRDARTRASVAARSGGNAGKPPAAGKPPGPQHVSALAKRCTESRTKAKIASAAHAARADKTEQCQPAGGLERREREWVWRPREKLDQASSSAGGGASRDGGKQDHAVSEDELNVNTGTVPVPSRSATAIADSDQDLLVSSDADSSSSGREDHEQSGDDDQTGTGLPEDMLWQYFEQVHLKQLQQATVADVSAPPSASAPGSAASGESAVMISPLAEQGEVISGGSWSSSWSPLPGSSEDEQTIRGGSGEVDAAAYGKGASRRSVAAAQ